MVDPLAEQLTALARDLHEEAGVEATLAGVVGAAIGTVPGADHAGVSQVEGRRALRTTAATDDLVRRIDQAQYDLGEGPCLDTLFTTRTVRVPELSTERRWPRFVARVRDLGVGSILAFQLYVAQDGLGALNLYSRTPYAFDDDAERVGALFATHAAIALSGAQQAEQLTHAVDVRDLIGQAKGILIERHRLTGDQAFRLLVRASQTTNTKLADVARRLIETGELADRGG